jgi:hypothetical protein
MEPAPGGAQETPLVCPECGAWLKKLALGTACEQCLNKRYLGIMLERERDLWVSTAFADVELSRGRTRLRHLVLKVDRGLAYCGAPATEPKKRRVPVRIDVLSDGVCTECLNNFHRVQKRAAERRRGEGVPT